MSSNMENGMVLAMSAWYAKETYPLSNGEQQTGMSWLDGENFWGGHTTKAGPCTQTTTANWNVVVGWREFLGRPYDQSWTVHSNYDSKLECRGWMERIFGAAIRPKLDRALKLRQQTGMSWLDGENFWGGHTTKA